MMYLHLFFFFPSNDEIDLLEKKKKIQCSLVSYLVYWENVSSMPMLSYHG